MEKLFSAAEMETLPIGGCLLPDDAQLFIFGCGFTGTSLLRRLRRAGRDAACFLDNNPSAQEIQISGLDVRKPESIPADEHKTTVVVAISKPWAYEIVDQCRQLGFGNIMLLEDFLEQYGDMGEYRRFASTPEVEEAFGVWGDGESLAAYTSLLRYRIDYKLCHLPPTLPDQYFNTSVIERRHLRSFVDCGAYVGDTLAEFLRRTGGNFDSYHAFEPDPSTFAMLKDKAEGDGRIFTHNMLVGKRAEAHRFMRNRGGHSRIMKNGGIEIRTATLDDILANERVTMIKMDVEGGELDALIGAEKTIRRERPALAISVYHYPEHLWEIPVWIARLGLGYKLALMRHSPGDHLETICYAV